MKPVWRKLDYFNLASIDIFDAGERTVVTRIKVPAAYRNQGHARSMMKELLDQADAEKVTLLLSIEPGDGLNLDELAAWYVRCGFKLIDENVYERKPQ